MMIRPYKVTFWVESMPMWQMVLMAGSPHEALALSRSPSEMIVECVTLVTIENMKSSQAKLEGAVNDLLSTG